MAKKDYIYVHGKPIHAKKLKEACEFNKGCSQYITARKKARERSRQIREKNGPQSMEWVQSALFLYACKKYGLSKDLKRAIWAYTTAMVVKLEKFVADSEKIASREGIADTFHWVALQLRAAIRQHTKLLDMFKDEDVEIPPLSKEGSCISGITHHPTDKDTDEAVTYVLTDFKQQNPEAEHLLPKKDEI
jgi:hypothetical protein